MKNKRKELKEMLEAMSVNWHPDIVVLAQEVLLNKYNKEEFDLTDFNRLGKHIIDDIDYELLVIVEETILKLNSFNIKYKNSL